MSKIKLAGKSISEILKRIKRAQRNKRATKNQERAGLSVKSIKPWNYRAGARDEQIVPVKKQSQKGSSFQPHRVRGKQGAASIRETSEGSAASWRDEMDKYFGDLRPSKFFKKASGGDINTGMKKLSPKQKAIAAKAPPPDKIDAKDFAVLKAEKAKGRGMGLQDEKIKPGKVMTARDGKAIKADPTKTITDKGQFVKRRMKLAGSKLPGRIGTALGIGAMMVPAAYAAAKQYKDYKSAKNRDEAKVKKYSVGGGADTGRRTYSSMEEMRTAKGFKPGETPAQFNKRKAAMEVAKKAAKATRIGKIVLPIAAAGVAGAAYLKNKLKKEDKKMGGGMMNKPMGYSKGGGYDAGVPGKVRDIVNKYTRVGNRLVGERLTNRDMDLLKEVGTKKINKMFRSKKFMGGGMMQRPMGYKKGVMVKARGCKLGRTRPTKIT